MKKEDGSYICDICQLPIHPVNLSIKEVHMHYLCESRAEEVQKEKVEEQKKKIEETLKEGEAQAKQLMKKALVHFLIYSGMLLFIGVCLGKFLWK